MIDDQGFRENVGIVLLNNERQILCARRTGMLVWQMPQGGIEKDETPEQAMYRELDEEIGVQSNSVKLLGTTNDWLYYRLPEKYQRAEEIPKCIGQKQIWFLLQFTGRDQQIRLDQQHPQEFEDWGWFAYWKPVEMVVDFKRDVYRTALGELQVFI